MMNETFDWCAPLLPIRSDLLVTDVTDVTNRADGFDLPADPSSGGETGQFGVTGVAQDIQIAAAVVQNHPHTHPDGPVVTQVTDVTKAPEGFECFLRCREAWAVLTSSDERAEQWNDIGITSFSTAEMEIIAAITKDQFMSNDVWCALVALKKFFPAARVIKKPG